jgi:2'-5' RNA ligase
LARAKGRAPVDVRPIVEALATYVGPRWTASALDLIRSHQGPQPYYETIASWPLRDYQA